MTTPPSASSSCLTTPVMDPFIHPFALEDLQGRHITAWNGFALLRGLRKRLSLPALKEEEQKTTPAKAKIPATRHVVQYIPPDTTSQIPSMRRPSFHQDRSLSKTRPVRSHGRKLSVIPETNDVNDDFSWLQHLSPTKAQPEQMNLPSRASLLGMPRELRDMILAHVFSDWTTPKSLNLLRTCRQIHAEGREMAFGKTLFRITTEHWPDHDYFQTYLSALSPTLVSSIQHLAVRLPRGVPYDCYSSRHLHVNLAGLGFRLKSLIIYSHLARPLPHISEYGGVLEANLCLWLKHTLYTMPSLNHICVLNYESQTPTLHDMPSPRLVRMLRSSIFKDVMAQCQTLSEQNFQWRCLTATDSLESSMSNCTADEKCYHVYSSKLKRAVQLVFQSDRYVSEYGLEHILNATTTVDSEKMLQQVHPDLSFKPYAGLLARKNSRTMQRSNVGRRKLSKTQDVRRETTLPRPDPPRRPLSYSAFPSVAIPETSTTASKMKRLSRRLSLLA